MKSCSHIGDSFLQGSKVSRAQSHTPVVKTGFEGVQGEFKSLDLSGEFSGESCSQSSLGEMGAQLWACRIGNWGMCKSGIHGEGQARGSLAEL